MIRTLFAASALLLASSGLAEAAGALDGHWDGAISRLGAIQRIRLDVVTDPSGAIHGTYDIPDLWLYGEPLTEVSLAGDDLTFHVLYGKFAGKLHGTVDELTGVNTAWDPPVGINLKRTPPIPEYRVRELRVAGKTTIAGSLYLPVSCTSCATVIVVPGSGDQSRATWSYRGYAAELARHGVAAFVYDKRGLGGSNGRWQTASFADLADDVAAIAQHLAHTGGVDARRIGAMGISQGGWIVPMAAAKTPLISFAMLIVGPAVTPQEQERERIAGTLRARGFGADDVAAALAFVDAQFAADYGELPPNELAARLAAAKATAWGKALALEADTPDDARWWRMNRYDPTETLRGLRVPVLAVFGERDILVPPDPNRTLMERDLAGNRRATIVTIAGMTHDPYTGQRLVGGAWAWPTSFWHFDERTPELAQKIFTWLEAHVQREDLRGRASSGRT